MYDKEPRFEIGDLVIFKPMSDSLLIVLKIRRTSSHHDGYDVCEGDFDYICKWLAPDRMVNSPMSCGIGMSPPSVSCLKKVS